jgi:hypothetical protein
MAARYTDGMKATVKVLREAGRRKPTQSIQSDRGIAGSLTLASVAGVMELKLYDPNDSQMAPLIPVLWDAKAVMMRGDKMLWHGLTARWEDGGVAQEWSIELRS